MDNCKHCNEQVSGNYCSNCGQPVNLKRIDRHYIMHEIRDVLFTDSGFFYTIKRMFVSPGDSVRIYLTEDRNRFVKPVTFLVVASLIYTVLSNLFHVGVEAYSMDQSEIELPTLNLFISWMIDYHGYASIIIGFCMALWIKLFFRKSGHTIYEIFVLICYTSGMASLFFSVIIILQGLTPLRLIHISAVIALVYQVWAAGQLFEKKKTVSYIKAFFAYILGVTTFSVSITMLGVIIDIFIKQ